MSRFEEKAYKVFEMFHKQRAVVTAGTIDHFNACTIGWGSLGTIWTNASNDKPVVTVYLYPTRYTLEFMKQNEFFTVSLFPEEYKKVVLGIMGAKSGRDCDKIAQSGLTPMAMGESVAYKEAELTFLCRKIYQHQMAKEDIAPQVQEYYRSNPKGYPVDENGEWQPHWAFIGEILEVRES